MNLEDYKSELLEQQLELLEAVEADTLSRVQELAQRFREMGIDDELFEYILVVAALRRGDRSIVQYFIDEGWNVKTPQKTGIYHTPLYYAVKISDIEIFKALCEKGASFHDKDANEESALELAVRENKLEMINFLLEDTRLADLTVDSESDVSLFHAACWANNARAVQKFITHGFPIRSRSIFIEEKWKGFTLLHFALANRTSSPQTFNILIQHDDIDVYAQDGKGRTFLHLAFKNRHNFAVNNETTMKRLTSSETQSTNLVDMNGLSHFHILCFMKFQKEYTMKQIDLIKNFIDNDVDVNSSVSLKDLSYPGFTALHFAAQESSMEVLELLLQNGADLTKTDEIGRTPLHLVCTYMVPPREHRLEIIRLLLQHGPDPIAKDTYDQTPLHNIFSPYSRRGLIDDSEEFLSSKIQWNINHTDKFGLSYLHMACTGDDLDRVKTLIANGAQINSCAGPDEPSLPGFTPLHMAVIFNKSEIVELLLTHGADPNCVGDEKLTPLHSACDSFQTLQHCYPLPDGNFDNDDGAVNNEGLDWLPSRTSHIRIIELLIQHGAIIDAEDSDHTTPLLRNSWMPDVNPSRPETVIESLTNEICTRQKMIMEILLNHGANVNFCNERGSILHVFASNYWKSPLIKDLVETVLKGGADANTVNEKGATPLHLAVYESMENEQDISLVELLIKYGANINSKTYVNPPLHMTLSRHESTPREIELFDMLVRNDGADVNELNYSGNSPLHLAILRGKHYQTKKLLELGADIEQTNKAKDVPTSAFVRMLRDDPALIDDENNREIEKILVMHIKKLRKLRKYTIDEINRHFDVLSRCLSLDDLALIDFEFEREVQYLKSKKLDQFTSFYDILFKRPHDVAKHVKNSEFETAISSIRSGTDFTFFGYFIKEKFNKGCQRLELLEPAKRFFNAITNSSWPDCCVDRVLSFLTNEDLKKFASSKGVEESRKRIVEDLTVFDESPSKIHHFE